MTPSDFIKLTCPTCGSPLQVERDLQRFSCASCGNEFLVRQSGGTVSLAPVVAAVDEIRRATARQAQAQDKIAAELALSRLQNDLHDLQDRKDKLNTQLVNGVALLVGLAALVGLVTYARLWALAPYVGLGVLLAGALIAWQGIALTNCRAQMTQLRNEEQKYRGVVNDG
jgi:ribosomal protein S27E